MWGWCLGLSVVVVAVWESTCVPAWSELACQLASGISASPGRLPIQLLLLCLLCTRCGHTTLS